jgi:acyl carrier protein
VVADNANPILAAVTASIHGTGGLPGDIPVLAGDTLEDLGLSRLRLLAVLIDLEDRFAIEFPADVDRWFRVVDDIEVYIQSHGMMPYDEDTDILPAAASYPIERQPSARASLSEVCSRFFGGVLGRVFREAWLGHATARHPI